jgi:hypothetical protein
MKIIWGDDTTGGEDVISASTRFHHVSSNEGNKETRETNKDHAEGWHH